jgi:hypothetical protein
MQLFCCSYPTHLLKVQIDGDPHFHWRKLAFWGRQGYVFMSKVEVLGKYHPSQRKAMKAATLTSIFSTLGPWEILGRLARIKVDAADFSGAIPEGIVHQLFKALERKLPETALAIEEIPSGRLTPDAIETVLKAAEAAIDARNAYLATA